MRDQQVSLMSSVKQKKIKKKSRWARWRSRSLSRVLE